MANERLTDKTELNDGIAVSDLVHLVDVSDTTDNAAGSSKKVQLGNLLKKISFVSILGCLVYRTGSSTNISAIQSGDWVIYMSTANDRLTIGIATGAITTIPSDLDGANFTKFYDGSSLL